MRINRATNVILNDFKKLSGNIEKSIPIEFSNEKKMVFLSIFSYALRNILWLKLKFSWFLQPAQHYKEKKIWKILCLHINIIFSKMGKKIEAEIFVKWVIYINDPHKILHLLCRSFLTSLELFLEKKIFQKKKFRSFISRTKLRSLVFFQIKNYFVFL